MRPLDDTRPGDLVALDFYMVRATHHLVIDDVSFSYFRRYATIRGGATVPGFAAAQREQAKFDADRASTRQPVCLEVA